MLDADESLSATVCHRVGPRIRIVQSGAGSEAYGHTCEHNRGDDGFLFLEDGSFWRSPEVSIAGLHAWLLSPACLCTTMAACMLLTWG